MRGTRESINQYATEAEIEVCWEAILNPDNFPLGTFPPTQDAVHGVISALVQAGEVQAPVNQVIPKPDVIYSWTDRFLQEPSDEIMAEDPFGEPLSDVEMTAENTGDGIVAPTGNVEDNIENGQGL